MVHHHDDTLPVRSVLEWTLPKTLKISNPEGKRTEVLFSGDKMEMDSVICGHGKQLRTELAYRFADESFSLKPKPPNGTNYQLHPISPATVSVLHLPVSAPTLTLQDAV